MLQPKAAQQQKTGCCCQLSRVQRAPPCLLGANSVPGRHPHPKAFKPKLTAAVAGDSVGGGAGGSGESGEALIAVAVDNVPLVRAGSAGHGLSDKVVVASGGLALGRGGLAIAVGGHGASALGALAGVQARVVEACGCFLETVRE